MNQTLRPGQVVNNNFEILACLGVGGYGAVYKARQIDLNRLVALKILHPHLSENPESIQRFQQEARILASLEHPSIVRCFSFSLWENRIPYLAFELLEGETLRATLQRQGKLNHSEAVSLALVASEALGYAHERKIVHRDLKPENIFVLQTKPELKAKILDFGLAKLLIESSKLTDSGVLMGSLNYMSPEQCSGQKATEQSDIYSLSAIIYECLSGQTPHSADTPIGLIFKHANEDPESLCQLDKNIPNALNAIVLKGLARDTNLRYSSAAEMHADLLRLEKALRDNIELTVSDIAFGSNNKAGVSTKRILNWPIIASLFLFFALLVFLLSDPGPAMFADLLALLMPKKDVASKLENWGDDLLDKKHYKGALRVYEKAAQPLNEDNNFSSSEKQRLLSKMALAAYYSGNVYECSAKIRQYLLDLKMSGGKVQQNDLQRVLTVAIIPEVEALLKRDPGDEEAKIAEIKARKNDPSFYRSPIPQLIQTSIDVGLSKEVEPLAKRYNDFFEKNSGPTGVELAVSRSMLETIYRKQKRFKEAELLYLRALRDAEHDPNPNYPLIFDFCMKAFRGSLQQGNLKDALKFSDKALLANSKISGVEKRPAAELEIEFAQNYFNANQFAQSASMCRNLLGSNQAGLSDKQKYQVSLLLSSCLAKQGERTGAAQLSAGLVELAEKLYGPESIEMSNQLLGLVMNKFYQGKFSECEALTRKALAIRTKLKGADSVEAADAGMYLSGVFRGKGDLAKAEELNAHYLSILEKLCPNATSTVSSREFLKEIRAQRKREKR
ncbi:MAG: serine/threonine-protein kinase [Candidatus Obscuribacterales bacterium]|nr:serine/threonine-protein kinase [Candidatus Obscuribacterales bacterium]